MHENIFHKITMVHLEIKNKLKIDILYRKHNTFMQIFFKTYKKA